MGKGKMKEGRLDESLEDGEVWSSESSDWIVSSGTVESGEGSGFAASGVDVVSNGDVIEGGWGALGSLVQPWVDESEGGFAGGETDVVEENEDTREDWSRCGSSSDDILDSSVDDDEFGISESGDIRSRASGVVEGTGLWHLDSRFKIGSDIAGLVVWDSESIRESSSRSERLDSSFLTRSSGKESGGSNGKNVWRGGRERWVEGTIASVGGLGDSGLASSSVISRSEDDGDSTGSEDLEVVVQAILVVVGWIVSLGSVRDRVHEWWIRLRLDLSCPGDQIVPEVELLHSVEPH